MDSAFLHKIPNTAAIRYFHAVAAAGSFRKAAEELHIAASAVNRHVRLLEADIGTKLFHRKRGRGGVMLTSAGEILMRRVRYALSELSTARAEIDSMRGRGRDRVRAGVSDALARSFMPDFLAAFHAENARVDFNIKVGNTPRMIEMLLADQVDIVLSYDVPQQIGLHFVAEYALGSSIVVHKDHPLAQKKSVRLAECANYTLALPDDEHYLRALVNRIFGESRAIRPPLLVTNSYELMSDFVERGIAMSLQTHFEMKGSKRRPNLVYVPVNEPLARYSAMALCVRSGRRLSASGDIFLNRLKEILDATIGQYRMMPSEAKRNRLK